MAAALDDGHAVRSSDGGSPRLQGKSAASERPEVPMIKGFRDFLFRGNVIDLAVAVVIGAAFNAVIQSFVKDVLTPFIAAIVGKPDFSGLGFDINGTHFPIGSFINALISFILVATAVYFAVVLPMNHAMSKLNIAHGTKPCPECASDIPAGAKRCKFCGQPVVVPA
jgi:large conductance mechanosensitive channel